MNWRSWRKKVCTHCGGKETRALEWARVILLMLQIAEVMLKVKEVAGL